MWLRSRTVNLLLVQANALRAGKAPMNVGNLRCISDDVQGEQGWCSVRIGPWHNVCVRVNVSKSSNNKEQIHNGNVYQ